MFAKFDEIPSMILQDIKETKPYGHTHSWTVGRTDGRADGRQCENSIPSHKHRLRGFKNNQNEGNEYSWNNKNVKVSNFPQNQTSANKIQH